MGARSSIQNELNPQLVNFIEYFKHDWNAFAAFCGKAESPIFLLAAWVSALLSFAFDSALVSFAPLYGIAFGAALVDFWRCFDRGNTGTGCCRAGQHVSIAAFLLMVALTLDGSVTSWLVTLLPLLPLLAFHSWIALEDWRKGLDDVTDICCSAFGFTVWFLVGVVALSSKQSGGILSILPYTVIVLVLTPVLVCSVEFLMAPVFL